MGFIHPDSRVSYKRGNRMNGEHGYAILESAGAGDSIYHIYMANGDEFWSWLTDNALSIIDTGIVPDHIRDYKFRQ